MPSAVTGYFTTVAIQAAKASIMPEFGNINGNLLKTQLTGKFEIG